MEGIEGKPDASRAPLTVDTGLTAASGTPDALLSPSLSNDVRIAGSTGSEIVRKGSNEWTSPRSRGRRGTPPPMPRRASHGTEDDVSVSSEQLPRPRTPAQVLANRAAAAKAITPPTATDPPVGGEIAVLLEAASKDIEVDEEKIRGPERRFNVIGESEKDDGDSGERETPETPRRTSLQPSAVGSELYEASEDGESYRRDDRVDTSTVDEESMYNDDDDDDDMDGDETLESAGTSDSYVNIHDHEQDDEEQSETYQQQQMDPNGEESLTPDSTPPPSPPRPTIYQQQRRQLPVPSLSLATDWVKYVAESGHEYYFNTRTNVSQWSKPIELLSPRHMPTAEEDEGPEENQTAHGDALQSSITHMLPQVQVHVSGSHVQQQQALPQTGHMTSNPSVHLEDLFAAASKNDETAQLQAILLYNIDVNAVSASGHTPLHIAVQHGNARGAALLLDHGAVVDGPYTEANAMVGSMYGAPRRIETPLIMACRTNHASLVRLLIRYGASIYTRDSDGNTVLHIAIRCWSEEVLNCLLEMDSVSAIINLRNAEDETPLHLAARHGNASAVKALLCSGASSDVEDAHGRTPLVVSIMENRVDCAQLLQGAAYAEVNADASIASTSNEPAMYDSMSKEDDSMKFSDELEGLRIYLGQLVQHTTTDGVLVSTIYQYMDAVQREITALSSANTESRQREENLIAQIDQLTNNESTTATELAQEREENERLRQQLEAKDSELSSLQAAYDSLSSRATMLESIARSSQEKLRRERAEFARQEEYWNQTIDSSLRDNATLLESVQSLQQGWQGQPIVNDTAAIASNEEAAMGDEVYEDSYSTAQQLGGYGDYTAQTHYDSYDAYYANTAYDESYDSNQQNYIDYQYGYSDHKIADSKVASSTPSAKSEPERPISPERVDAVWNRFFENMSRAADVRDTQTSKNPVHSSRHSAVPASMLPPASAVFDAVRKNSKDRLHQLLLSGISPNIRDLGEKGTPLHLAAELGDLESVMLLCEFGGDVEIRDENGNTPLLAACSQGQFECTKFLLQSAANHAACNTNRDTALHLAAWDGSFECIEILLEYGVDVLAQNSLGLTALGNLRTRSPLRHRFDDLASDHPMAKTLVLLGEAEQFEQNDTVEPAQAIPADTMAARNAQDTKSVSDTNIQAGSTSWGRWILGSFFGSFNANKPTATATLSDDDDESKSEFEEAESSPSKLRAAVLRDYEDLRLPPEIEAELRRKPLSPASDPLPPPPPEVLDALEKRKMSGGGGSLLSPTASVTRFGSPASVQTTKKSATSTPTSVRSRYVDTFNSQ